MRHEEIINILEGFPSGLSISEISKKSGLHRNTVSSAIKNFLKSDIILEKKIGSAKIYYLKKYHALHKGKTEYQSKNIRVGMGVSDLHDGYQAAISAAKQAAMQSSHGKEPTFSLVFVSSKYNSQIEKVVRGINKILGNNWIGCTTDCELNSILGFAKGTVEVICIDSKYLHFNVSVVENYRKNPHESGVIAIKDAINKSIDDRSLYATSQFMRGTKKDFTDIIKNPPYFILTFISGLYFDKGRPVLGLEFEFLEGVKEAIGPFVPIVGASAISDTDKFLLNVGENYQFANGRLYKDAAVVCFVVSELYFSYGLEHGYISTNKEGRITKVSGNGRIIEEINEKCAVDEYCKMVNIKKDDFTQKSMIYTTFSPITLIDTISGDIYPIAAGANPNGKTLFVFTKLFSNSLINISQHNQEKSINAMADAITQAKVGHEEKDIALCLLFSCAGRKNALGEKIKDVINKTKEVHGNLPFFGFYSNGEIGARRNQISRYNNFTVTNLVIFDKLQTE